MRKYRTARKSRPAAFSRALGLAFCCLVLLAAGLATAPQSALAQTKRYHMDPYNANIVVNKDGSLDVDEALTYVYDEGSFHRGSRNIPLDRVDGISNVQILEDGVRPYRKTSYDPDESTSGEPGTFGTTTEGNQFKIRWVYNYVSGTTKTFHLRYHAAGAVRVYDNRDELDWFAIPPDWSSPIYSSQVRVDLPAGTDMGKVTVATTNSSAEATRQGNTLVWTASNGLDNGLEVGAQLPKGVLNATRPSWQAAIDRQESYNKNVKPLVDFGVLLLSLIVLLGGTLLAVMRWYKSGRDKPVKLLSDYIAAPPSNLPPGLVGTLLDEKADVRDVIATVVDQGRKGNLTIQEVDHGGLFSAKDFEYKKTGDKVEYRFEGMVLNALFKDGDTVRLSDLKNHFYSDLPPIYDEMYKSLVTLKYFPEDPKAVRSRNMGAGVGIMVLGGLIFFGASSILATFSSLTVLLGVAVGIVGLIWVMLSGAMPRKTDFGSEEAEKWRAFERYLAQMQRYTNVQAAADKFQQYLPYAVAMGIERQFIGQFNSVPAAMPAWYAPYGYYPYGYFPVGAGTGSRSAGEGGGGGPGPGPGGAMPQFDPGAAMQGMSNSLASAMQGMSDSFTSMVNSASSILTSAPSSSGSGGGGWGGGGGGFGGGGGGGGGGGAD